MTSPTNEANEAGTRRSVSLGRANLVAAALAPIWAAASLLPLYLQHGAASLEAAWQTVTHLPMFVPLMLVSIATHEAIHGVGLLHAGVPRTALRFGFQSGTLTPYASTAHPVPIRGYRVAVAAPAVLLGMVPLVLGWWTGLGALTVYAFWMLCFAGGDVLILWLVRDVRAESLVVDLPDRAGCRIVDGSAQHALAGDEPAAIFRDSQTAAHAGSRLKLNVGRPLRSDPLTLVVVSHMIPL